MKQLIVIKPNGISPEDKALLKESGVIVIEHENPSEVRVINQTEGFEGNDLFNALIDAVKTSSSGTMQTFAQSLFKKIQTKPKQ